ncbi:cytochrome p450 monooxygenase [Colletotrichum tofieldiae]|uniref:Cytochrome p450 monooxygenase n=1 Tax=Colletotrichum tofieldiae TaxID=708197 RepID=A0A166N3M3_9PEZI|nr:cytochrome p450 monooxygenase [Colletotrichum tofieldiae]
MEDNAKNGLHNGLSWIPPNWASFIAIALLFLYVLRNAALPKPLKGIPYNRTSAKRLLGDIPDMSSSPSRREWFVDQVRRHNSPLVQLFFVPFSRPIVICADPIEAQDICTRRTSEFKRNSKLKDILGGLTPYHRLVMADDDPRLKKNRELGKDLMTPGFLYEVSAPQIYDKSMRLVELWTQKNRLSNGRPFEAGKDIHNVALDVILSVAFNPDPTKNITARNIAHFESISSPLATSGDQDLPVEIENLAAEPLVKALGILTDTAGTLFTSSMPRLRSWFLLREKPKKEAIASRAAMEARELGSAVERIEAGETPRCAMDQMMIRERSIAEKEGRSPEYYSDTIKDELLGYLVAGHDTTSSATQWGIKFLTRCQTVQTRLRADLRAAFPAADRPPSVTEIIKAQIPYLDAVIEEILRCCKTLPIMSREARVDTQILGAMIPKGTVVMFLAHGPGVLRPAVPVDETKRTENGRNAKKRVGTWDPEEIEEFQPERWLKKDMNGTEVFDSNAGPLMTFGYGPRACFGRRLAYLEMRIVLFLLVWSFEMQELSKELSTWAALDGLTTIPRSCYVKLRKV